MKMCDWMGDGTFQTRDPVHLLPSWETLGIQRLEYLHLVWNPIHIKDNVARNRFKKFSHEN